MKQAELVTLSLNPAIDVTLYLPALEPGGEYEGVSEQWEAGGKGANVSRCFSACGVVHTAVAVLGRENAPRFLAALEREGGTCLPVYTDGSIRENLTLAVPGQSVVHITRRGFVLPEEALAQVTGLLLPLADRGAQVVIGGKLPQGLTIPRFTAFCTELQRRGAELILDTSSLGGDEAAALRPWLMKPNRAELEAMAGRPLPDERAVRQAAEDLRRRGMARLLVSLGEQGAYYTGPEGQFRAQAPGVEVKSPVGAGDSLLAEFLMARREGLPTGECLGRAVAAGTASCLQYGTLPPRREDLLLLLPHVRVEPAKE